MHPLPEISPAPWRPRSLPLPPAPRQRHPWVMAAIIAGHAGALFLVARGMAPETRQAVEEEITEVRFETRPVLEPVAIPIPIPIQLPVEPRDPVRTRVKAATKSPMPRPRPTLSSPASDSLIAIEPAPRSAEPLTLFDRNGRVNLPDGLMEKLDAQSGNKRVFDYQVPGLATSGTFFDRPQALAHEHNRFEKMYRPNQNLLNDLLTRMVEKTTKDVRIKIPGNPRAKIVCSVSLLALGGGCAVQQNQGNYVITDDPNTLSVEEQAQCKAWWDKIVGATSQAVWLKTRDLYEQECRKPPEHKPSTQEGLEPIPGRIKNWGEP